MIWSLYIATNACNGKQYVGLTKNLDRRRKHTEETKAKIRASNIATKAISKAQRLAENKVTL